MKLTWQGAICSLCFLLLELQCGNAVLRHSVVVRAPPVHDKTSQSLAEAGAPNDALAGRRKLSYLVAMKAWQRVTKMGIVCPKPQPCECHCDCPKTVVAKAPPPRPACPVFPAFPSPAPVAPVKKAEQRVALQGTPPPAPHACEVGQVALSDGTCKVIDINIIKQLVTAVEAKKAMLEDVQGKYNSLHKPTCVSCPGAAVYYEMRPKLIESHKQYRAALGFLLNAMAAMRETDEVEKLGAKGSGNSGPEFVPGKKKLRPHCEPWTVDGTTRPSNSMCAVLCRNEPSCAGFAKDSKSHWCVWFDSEVSKPEDACSTATETEFLKATSGPVNGKVWTAMEKIHVFDTAIVEALKMAELQSDAATKTFDQMKGFGGSNDTIKLSLRDNLTDTMEDYTGTIIDTAKIREQYLVLQKAAYTLASAEALANPPFSEPALQPAPAEVPDAEVSKPLVGLHNPVAAKPKPLQWKDFPNSQDTEWSKLHPDCPMGTPCVCDCRCRGPPPQNFVEAPQVPEPPCPPAPVLPNPMILSPVR